MRLLVPAPVGGVDARDDGLLLLQHALVSELGSLCVWTPAGPARHFLILVMDEDIENAYAAFMDELDAPPAAPLQCCSWGQCRGSRAQPPGS